MREYNNLYCTQAFNKLSGNDISATLQLLLLLFSLLEGNCTMKTSFYAKELVVEMNITDYIINAQMN